MNKSELKNLIKSILQEQTTRSNVPNPRRGGAPGRGVTRTVPQVVMWIDNNVPEAKKPNAWQRFKHAVGSLWNNCGGPPDCPMPH